MISGTSGDGAVYSRENTPLAVLHSELDFASESRVLDSTIRRRREGAAREVIDSGFLNDGEVTTQFESQMAELLACKHVVATTSGTAAIFLALAGLGVGAGDEVIVPDVTFIATANAVTLTGAKPVLVDIDPAKLTLDPECTERAITARTKAIVPVHVSGRAADMDAILDIAKRHGLLVVEDAAEALLSKHQGRCLGTFGIAGCFSLSPNKTVTTGQGGLVATDDDRLHVRLRELKDQGRPVRAPEGTMPTTASAIISSLRICRLPLAWRNSRICSADSTE